MSAVAETAVDGLVASAPLALPFAPSLEVRSFLLERAAGELLIYSAGPDDRTATRRYLGHHHEAMFPPRGSDVPVFMHAADRPEVGGELPVRATFGRRHRLGDDFEAIPIPGHTPGSTAYLWDTGQHRLLFTADSVYLRDGEWVAAVLRSSDRDAYLQSLDLMRDVEFDVLVPWAAPAGEAPIAFTDEADRTRRLEAILDRVWRGLDH